jgi:hypothetical protein
MATQRRRAKKPSNKFNTDKLHNIWHALSVETWLEILNKHKHSHGWYEKNKGDIWGQCINHSEDTASFHLVPERGFGHCFACNYHVVDPVKIVAKIMGNTYDEAFAFVVNQYGPIQGLTARTVAAARKYAKLQSTKALVVQLLNAELVDAARSYMSGSIEAKYKYAERCLRYLIQRNIPIDILHTLPLLIVCPPGNLYDRIKEYERLTGNHISSDVQAYLEQIVPKGAGGAKSPFEGWLIFTNHLSPDSIGLFRVREPNEDGGKNIFALTESEVESSIGYFGLGTPIFTPLLGTDTAQAKSVIVVEGEFDALSGIVPQVVSGSVNHVILSAGGNSNVCLDNLVSCGFENVLYIPDWDGSGNTVFEAKLKATSKLRFRIFNPPEAFQTAGKDLHDAYMQLGAATCLQEITDLNNYLFPHEWAIQRTLDEGSDIPDNDVRAKTQLAHSYIKLLNDAAEKDSFVKSVAKALGVDEDSLRKYATPDTEEGFIELACNYLDTIYSLMYQENTLGGKRIVAWNKQARSTVIFDMARFSSIMAVFKVDLGPTVDWVDKHVGTHPDMQSLIDEDGNIIAKSRDKKTKFYSYSLESDVLPRLIQRRQLRVKSDMLYVGQGIHAPDSRRIYVVNGNTVYKGELTDTNEYEWVELQVPQDEEFLFDTDSRKAWSTAISSVDDIVTTKEESLGDILDKVAETLNAGFRFVHHDLECEYLSAFLLAAPLIDLFDHVPWIFVNGPTASGKSSLNQILASSDVTKRSVSLFEHAISLDNATPAGVKQSMKGTTLALVLDEFEVGPETSHEAKHIKCREILELIRGSMGRGARIAMGSASGQPVYWTLRFPFIASGIHTFHKQEDMNRFNVIEMATKDPAVSRIKLSSPKYLILDRYKETELRKLRESITCSLLQNVQAIAQSYKEVKKEFSSGQHTDPNTHARFREQLLPILAVMKTAGKDYIEFAGKYTAYKANRMLETTVQNKYDEIWQAILHTNALIIPGEEITRQTFTLAQILNDVHKRPTLNMMNAGVYFLQEEEMLAVVWTTALSGPLLRHTKYASYGGVEKIKAIVGQDPRVLDNTKRRQYRKLIPILSAFVGRVQWKDVTFVPLKEFIVGISHTPESDNILEANAAPNTNLHKLKSRHEAEMLVTGEDNI